MLRERNDYRLHVSREIQEVLRHGVKRQTLWFRVIYRLRPDQPARFTVIVGRRFGGAVERNRCKRRFRALLRVWALAHEGADLVMIPFPSAPAASAGELAAALHQVLVREGLEPNG